MAWTRQAAVAPGCCGANRGAAPAGQASPQAAPAVNNQHAPVPRRLQQLPHPHVAVLQAQRDARLSWQEGGAACHARRRTRSARHAIDMLVKRPRRCGTARPPGISLWLQGRGSCVARQNLCREHGGRDHNGYGGAWRLERFDKMGSLVAGRAGGTAGMTLAAGFSQHETARCSIGSRAQHSCNESVRAPKCTLGSLPLAPQGETRWSSCQVPVKSRRGRQNGTHLSSPGCSTPIFDSATTSTGFSRWASHRSAVA